MIEMVAGGVAAGATMIAAMMTAANAGTRVTGWGFALFAVGAVAWIVDALATGQRSLLLSNSVLLLIDLVGVWRWLGRQSGYDEAAQGARAASGESSAPTLFPLGALAGKPIHHDGETLGDVAETMAAAADGRIAYLVVTRGGVGGVGERLHALGWGEVRYRDDGLATDVAPTTLDARPRLDRACWPATAEAAGVG